MVYSLEQQIFLALEYHCLDHNIIETRGSFQRKLISQLEREYNLKSENFQQGGSINDDHTRNILYLNGAVTEANVKVIQQMKQQWP